MAYNVKEWYRHLFGYEEKIEELNNKMKENGN